MIKNKEKDEIQLQAVKLSESHPSLLLSFSTGVGKSLSALKIIERNSEEDWYILCKETNHIRNWYEEIIKHKKEDLLPKIKIFCYDSLHKYLGTKANLVLDEGHAITPLRLSQIKQIEYNKVIILSATVEEDKKDLLRQITGSLKEFHISISDAIKKGLLPPPKVFIVDIYLNEEQQKQYKKLCNRVEFFKTEHFRKQTEQSQFIWLNSALKRKQFLANCKTEKTKELLDNLKNKRLVCFTGSIQQCIQLGGRYVVHSKNKESVKIINAFNKLKIDKIFAVNMLREAMNFTNIEAGIVVQLDNKKLMFYQSLGRVLRSSYPEFYMLVVKDTQDEVYLQNVLKGFDTKYLYKY